MVFYLQNDATETGPRKYNRLIKLPFKYNCEKLFRKETVYDILLVLNFGVMVIEKSPVDPPFFVPAAKEEVSGELLEIKMVGTAEVNLSLPLVTRRWS